MTKKSRNNEGANSQIRPLGKNVYTSLGSTAKHCFRNNHIYHLHVSESLSLLFYTSGPLNFNVKPWNVLKWASTIECLIIGPMGSKGRVGAHAAHGAFRGLMGPKGPWGPWSTYPTCIKHKVIYDPSNRPQTYIYIYIYIYVYAYLIICVSLGN
jgi:hypothetical protein